MDLFLVKSMQHSMNLQAYSNEESQQTDSEDFEQFQFVNSPNDGKLLI